jgi:hypothetical protein
LKFTPGDEYRAKVGVDHAAGNGRISLGLTYSAFGDDVAGSSVYNTGNRLIAQGVLTNTMSGNDVTVAAYNVFRATGNYANGEPAGRENIANLYAGVGLRMLGTIVEPSIEGRHWLQNVPTISATAGQIAHTQSSYLGTIGVRTRIGLGGLSAFPSVGYTLGRLAIATPSNTAVHADMTGFRAQLAIRIAQ